MDAIMNFIIDASGNPWMYVLVLLACLIDGFFPPMPGETVVVALAALASGTGEPNLWALAAVAAVGTAAGDNVAYGLGRLIGTRRRVSRFTTRPRMAGALTWAGRALHRRGPYVILTGRYVPVGRVAINMVAGATGFARGKFMLLTAVSGTTWAGCYTILGAAVGNWAHEAPLLAAGAAVVIAVAIGVVIDQLSRWRRRVAARRARPAPEPEILCSATAE